MHEPHPPRAVTSRTSVDALKREARRWLRRLRDGDPEARARLDRALPTRARTAPTLRDVQHALAREHGQPGWSALLRALAARSSGAAPDVVAPDVVARFLECACTDWRVGGSQNAMHRAAAMRLLAKHPALPRASFLTAVVCGDVDAVARALAGDPSLATTSGGPRGWPPLLWLVNARLDDDDAMRAAPELARLLLDAGADPNAWYPGGSPSIRYSAVCGAVGRGEEQKPTHPEAPALVRLVLERGAEPYDTQLLYNVFANHASRPHLGDVRWLLELLHEASAARGRRADWDDPEWSMLDLGGYGHGAYYLLRAAVERNDVGLAEWLLAHGAGANATAPVRKRDGAQQPTLWAIAATRGLAGMTSLLERHGARRGGVVRSDDDAFVAAALRLDRAAVEALLRASSAPLGPARAMQLAAEHDRDDVVRLLLDLGVPADVETPERHRALHMAAYGGAARVVALLLARGADPDFVNPTWGSTPLDAAIFGRQPATIALLAPVSRDLGALAFLGEVDRLRAVLDAEPVLATGDAGRAALRWLPDDEQAALAVVELLLAHGADRGARDPAGLTAAERARERGLDAAADLLEGA